MNELNTLKSAVVKTLAIVGFLATLVFIIIILMRGVTYAPSAFSSLAGILDRLQNHTDSFMVSTDAEVINSGESFEIAWTDMKVEGTYTFTYTCVGGVNLEVQSVKDNLVPIKCSDSLALSSDVHGLFLTITSTKSRFTHVLLNVEFTSSISSTTASSTLTVTVVNTAVAFDTTTAEKDSFAEAKKDTPKKEAFASTPITHTSPYPASNPNGTPDLSMNIIGSGVLMNSIFSLSTNYGSDRKNAVKFDVKNLVTKRSGTWYFVILLPNGETYTSTTQIALGPQEHIEYTLGFPVSSGTIGTITLTPTLYATDDTNPTNNAASIDVHVE